MTGFKRSMVVRALILVITLCAVSFEPDRPASVQGAAGSAARERGGWFVGPLPVSPGLASFATRAATSQRRIEKKRAGRRVRRALRRAMDDQIEDRVLQDELEDSLRDSDPNPQTAAERASVTVSYPASTTAPVYGTSSDHPRSPSIARIFRPPKVVSSIV